MTSGLRKIGAHCDHIIKAEDTRRDTHDADDEQLLRAPALLSVRFMRATLYMVGEETMITCEVDSDPTDVTFKWFYNNSSETTEVKSFASTGTRSVLKYTPQSRFSYGTLFCIAENNIGVQSKPCIFTLKLVSQSIVMTFIFHDF